MDVFTAAALASLLRGKGLLLELPISQFQDTEISYASAVAEACDRSKLCLIRGSRHSLDCPTDGKTIQIADAYDHEQAAAISSSRLACLELGFYLAA